MKKTIIACAVCAVALFITGCKSSENAYRKAYEKAKAEETTTKKVVVEEVETIKVAAPVIEKTVVETKTDNDGFREETLVLVQGDGLKAYNVVVGSFSILTNAESLQRTLRNNGYSAQLAKNPVNGMYRVIAATYYTKSEAQQARDRFLSAYPGAWLLYNK